MSGTALPQAARPRLATLAERPGKTVNLSVWDGRQAIIVVQALGTITLPMYRFPLKRQAELLVMVEATAAEISA